MYRSEPGRTQDEKWGVAHWIATGEITGYIAQNDLRKIERGVTSGHLTIPENA